MRHGLKNVRRRLEHCLKSVLKDGQEEGRPEDIVFLAYFGGGVLKGLAM